MGCHITLDIKEDTNTNPKPLISRKIVPVLHEQSTSPIKELNKKKTTKVKRSTNTTPPKKHNIKIQKISNDATISPDKEETNGSESNSEHNKNRFKDKARLIAAWERGLPPRTTGER